MSAMFSTVQNEVRLQRRGTSVARGSAQAESSETTRTGGNRSLERGIEILRAFRPGSDLLGNGELAERSGLPRATVSRLTRTLVDAGLLEEDRRHRAYRLAAPVLSLAHAMRTGSPVLATAGPMMRETAEKMRINVGLAVADREEMVYLESVRYARRVSLRNVVAGQRVPMELTSLGRAWMSQASESMRRALFERFEARRQHGWPAMAAEIDAAIQMVEERGFCWAAWQPQVLALATPLVVPGHPIYVLNMSIADAETIEQAEREVERLHQPLLELGRRISDAIADI